MEVDKLLFLKCAYICISVNMFQISYTVYFMYLFDQDGFTTATATILIVIKSQLKQLSTLKEDDFNMLSSTQTNPQGPSRVIEYIASAFFKQEKKLIPTARNYYLLKMFKANNRSFVFCELLDCIQ